jgi:hypothetical protein
MQWTMPHRVLQIVAALIGLAAVTSFILGILNAPQHSARLPGEKLGGSGGSAAVIDAPDATPLSDERIGGPAAPAAEDAAKAEAKRAEADAGNTDDDNDNAAPAVNAPAPPMVRSIPPAAGNATDQTLGGPPAPDEPPH